MQCYESKYEIKGEIFVALPIIAFLNFAVRNETVYTRILI